MSNNEPEILDDDYVIADVPGGYYVNQLSETFSEFDDVVKAIVEDIRINNFFPSIWFSNDHGNLDLMAFNSSYTELKTVQSWV